MSVIADNPVPSITLSITQDDVRRVLDASDAMNSTLNIIQKRRSADHSNSKLARKSQNCNQDSIGDAESADGNSKAHYSSATRPLHEVILDAAHQCDNSTLRSFLEKMKASGSSQKEIHAAVLVFCDMDFKSKLRLMFEILGTNCSSCSEKENLEKALNRDGLKSLFRSVIVAISSCIHQGPSVEVEIEKDEDHEGPLKKKMKSDSTSIRSCDSIPELKSPSSSFDSLQSTKESEDLGVSTVRKEFEEIAAYSTDCLVKYCQRKSLTKGSVASVSFETFCAWNEAEGARIAPWLDLLNLSKWKTPTRPTTATKGSEPSPRPVVDRETIVSGSTETSEQKECLPSEVISPKKRQHHPLSSPTTKPDVFRVQSPAVFGGVSHSRTVVSFDFTGASASSGQNSDFHINISEENLLTLRNLVRATGLATRQPHDVAKILLSASKSCSHGGTNIRVIPIERFHTCLHQLLGLTTFRRLSKVDRDVFSSSFVDFFSCFNTCAQPLQPGEANACELAVGFCFLCAGNKSSKLASGFELLENGNAEGLSTTQLAQFLRSYLTMLVGISVLTSSTEGVMKPKQSSTKRKTMHAAVENGANWTLAHYLKHMERIGHRPDRMMHTFDGFADWYTSGGYNVAPWLELLDLKKLLSLIGDASDRSVASSRTNDHDPLGVPSFPASRDATSRYMSPRRSRVLPPPNPYSSQGNSSPQPEILFTFPLANHRSLVVLREDATYVKDVVNQLGLLSCSPDDVWSSLFKVARNQPSNSTKQGKNMTLSSSAFTRCMEDTIACRTSRKKRGANGTPKSTSNRGEVLRNFFHSFDLHQIGSVPLNELMGGLTLLCGGKKSTKLAFAFGVFDQRRDQTGSGNNAGSGSNSLNGEELFLFLRSFLIVMFSCCRQSLDLSDDCVNRYIADTANMVADDVMRYQWKTMKKDRVDFDEFGLWYNEGGYETAPWLELLDLHKWVLTDEIETPASSQPPASDTPAYNAMLTEALDCPPPPPDDAVDASFFDDDDNAIIPMESIDEMDLILMQPAEKENDTVLNKISRSFSYPPSPQLEQAGMTRKTSCLKFHLVVEGENAGYVVAVSQKRIRHIRRILEDTGLCELEGEAVSKQIFKHSLVSRNAALASTITKEGFDSAMRDVIAMKGSSATAQNTLSEVLSKLYAGFDYNRSGRVDAIEIACGITVLCRGKKSDKLEFAFEMLGRERGGRLTRHDAARYLRSFLSVLLNLVSVDTLDGDVNEDFMTASDGSHCERDSKSLARVVEGGSLWAANQAFPKENREQVQICFDEFAEWYTKVGYSNIPWLELLDLHKWIIVDR